MGRLENSNTLGQHVGGTYTLKRKPIPPGRDAFIRVRETLLDRLTGGHARQALNDGEGTEGEQAKAPPAEQFERELREALRAIARKAVWDRGRRVDYNALRESPAYAAYRLSCWPGLRSLRPERLKTPAERLAFWINLYNALTLDAVVSMKADNGKGLGSLQALSFFRNACYLVGGQRVSLDDIQHGVLRGNKGHPAMPGPHFNSHDPRLDWVIPPVENGIFDPRIHMALNSGRRSCPPMRVYDPEYLDVQLDLAARSFVDRSVGFNPVRASISLSPVFRWYQGDFGGAQGVLDFLKRYLPGDERLDWIETYGEELHLVYEHYDWSLNV